MQTIFRRIIKNSKYEKRYTSTYTVVVLTNLKEPKKIEVLDALFEDAWEAHLQNFLILTFDQSIQAWTLMTYFPFKFDCETLSYRVIETFTNDNYTAEMKIPFKEVFPEKMLNMKKCPVLVSVVEVEPYVIVREKNNYNLDGIDVKIMLEIAKHMNFTPKFIKPKVGRGRGVVYKNGTATGAMQQVINGEADVTIGSYMETVDRSLWLSPTTTYMQEKMGFAVRDKSIAPSSLNHLMGPFSFNSWTLILTTLILAALFILITKLLKAHYRRFLIGGKLHRAPILTAFHLAIGGSIDNPRMKQRRYFGTFARTLTMLWILLFFFIRSSYEGGLFTLFNKPPHFSKCDTFEKIRAHQCKVISPDSGIHFLTSFNTTLSQ